METRSGERVGVGPYVHVCGERNCHECQNGMPGYCPKRVPAYEVGRLQAFVSPLGSFMGAGTLFPLHADQIYFRK